MSASREQIMTALLARLQGAYSFGVVGRRNPRDAATIAQPGAPALIVFQHHGKADVKAINLPTKRTITAVAIVYLNVGSDENVVLDTIFNEIEDAMESALSPDDPIRGTCTLGGLVQSVKIEGETIRDSTGETGRGLFVVPITIVLP